jgi:DNA-binding FrmR family transcriptional regulator
MARIEGQVRGLRGMVADRRYCLDVLDQVEAIRAALAAAGGLILRNHIETCVASAVASPDAPERDRKISELVKLYGRLSAGRC